MPMFQPSVSGDGNSLPTPVAIPPVPASPAAAAVAVAFAGRRAWRTPGPNAPWPANLDRRPKNWAASTAAARGDRRVIAKNGATNQINYTSTTDTTQYYVLTCVTAGTTSATRPTVNSSGSTVINDGSAQWIASDVRWCDGSSGGTGLSASSPLTSPAGIGSAALRSALLLFKCGSTTGGTYINIYGGFGAYSANGVTAKMQLSWYGSFTSGLPLVYNGQWMDSDVEFFQLQLGDAANGVQTSAGAVNLGIYGCKLVGKGATGAFTMYFNPGAAKNYKSLVLEDNEMNGHTGGSGVGYDGININIQSYASFDLIALRNNVATGNGRYGIYIGISPADTSAAKAVSIGQFEFVNNSVCNNGSIGWYMPNPKAYLQPINRVPRGIIRNNEYVANGSAGASFEGFGSPAAKYQVLIQAEKATGNMALPGPSGTGNYQPTGLMYSILECGYFDAAGSSGNNFDGVGLYLDVISTGDAYATGAVPVGNIVRDNVCTGSTAGSQWFSEDGSLRVTDWLATTGAAGLSLLRGIGNHVYRNTCIGNGVGILPLLGADNVIQGNYCSANEIGIFAYRECGLNTIKGNTSVGNGANFAQGDERFVAGAASATFALAQDPNAPDAMNVTASAAVITGVCYLAEVGGTGVGVINGYQSNQTTGTIKVLRPFSKSSYAPGELEMFAHRNLATNPRAIGSFGGNVASAGSLPAAKCGSAWGNASWVANADYANGLSPSN